MLTHSAAAADGSSYYSEGKYYTQDQVPSGWHGGGTASLGLEGAVDPHTFDQLLNGTLPDGTRLPGHPTGERRHGDDWTFSPPKSVSVAGLVGQDLRVVQAHDRSVRKALDHMEREMFGSRALTGAGREHVPAGAVVGVFRHETSRPTERDPIGDPQLHSHCVWVNAARREDGQWRAADWSLDPGAKLLADRVYLSELAADLRQYGYELHPTADAYEISGVPHGVLDGFSRRSSQIEAELEKIGKTRETASHAARQTANLRTRGDKTCLPREQQWTEWQERARGMGLDAQRFVSDTAARSREATIRYQAGREERAQGALESAVRHASERESLISQRTLSSETLRAGLADGVVLEDARRAAETDPSGELVTTGVEGLWTTRETVNQERTLLDMVRAERGTQRPALNGDPLLQVTGRLEERSFTGGQLEAVRVGLTTSDRFAGVHGSAGSGKSTALDALRTEFETRGLVVRGLAPSAQAAKELQARAGISSSTLASWLRTRTPETLGGTVYILDEAGMVSTREMLAFAERVKREDARAVLVGDYRQLPPVEAGAPFRALVHDGMSTATLTEVKRQSAQDLREVVQAYARGEAQRGAQLASAHFHHVDGPPGQAADLASAASRDYLARPPEVRDRTLVLGASNDVRRAANEEIRQGLREEGVLGQELQVRTLHRVEMTREEARQAHNYGLGRVVVPRRDYQERGVSSPVRRGSEYTVREVRDDRVTLEPHGGGELVEWDPTVASKWNQYREGRTPLAEGDRVIWRENSRELGVVNGDRATVVHVEDHQVRVRLDRSHQEVTIGEDLGARLDHSYATTVHAAQGATMDHVVIVGELGQLATSEQAYVALSRARESAIVYTRDPERLREAWSRWENKPNALDHLDRVQLDQWAQAHQVPSAEQELGVPDLERPDRDRDTHQEPSPPLTGKPKALELER